MPNKIRFLDKKISEPLYPGESLEAMQAIRALLGLNPVWFDCIGYPYLEVQGDDK